MKKALSILLTVAMLLSLTAGLDFSAYALASSGSCGANVTYTFDSSTGLLTISGTGDMTNYNDSGSPFYYNTSIRKVVIDEGVTSIGDYAFLCCNSINEVSLSNSIVSIGSGAFKDCYGITKVNIGSVEEWLNISFENSYSNPLSYGHNLYINNNFVTDLVIPNSITLIKDYAFECWESLNQVIIPGSVTSIGYSAFSSCRNLMSVKISEGVVSISNNAFSLCRNLASVVIPNSVNYIGDRAFEDCFALESVTFGSSVKNIGADAFLHCSNLSEVNIDSLEEWCNISFVTPESNPLVYSRNLRVNKAFLRDLIVPSTVTTINNYAFYNCILNSVSFSDNITNIGNNAFFDCYYINEIRIPKKVRNVGSGAFEDCRELKKVTIESNDIQISSSAFDGAKREISEITLPASLKFDTSCFNDCSALTKINLSVGSGYMTDWSVDFADSLWYKNRDTIREIHLDEGIMNISESAFYDCTNLIKTNIPSTVITVGRYAYLGCTNLKNLTVYSKNCNIPMSPSTIDPLATIYAYDSSTAEKYAKEYKRDFVSIGEYFCNNHVPVIDYAVPATYTSAGKTAGSHCSVCGAILVAQKPIAKLSKKANTITVKTKKPTVTFAKLKEKNQTIALKKAMTVSKAQGTVTYKLSSAKKGKKNVKKYFKVAKNGKITVKKGLKKGTYKVKIKVTASGNTEYKAAVKTVTITITVK